MPLGKEDIEFLLKRNDKMKSTRQLYEPLWEEIAKFMLPGRVGIGYVPTPGAKQTSDIYDSTAIFANEQFAASMCGTLTPFATRWHYLKLADERLNQIKEIMDWLEQCGNLQHYTRQRSNFYAEIPEVYSDLSAFGEGCMLIEENPIKTIGFNGLYYKAFANSEYCTAENHQGFVDTVFREFELSAIAARTKFKDGLNKKILDVVEKEPDKKFRFLHCVFPNEENGNGKKFVSYYTDMENKELASEGGYYEFPYVVPRLRKTSGEEYGRGQGHIATPDTKSLNKAKEFGLKAWALDLNPPTFERDQGVIGSLKMKPGGRNIVRDKESIWMMDHKIRYEVSQIKEEELRKSIKQIFFSDQLNLPEKSDMREMEVAVRYEMMQRILGPGMGRIQIELLKYLIEREFGLMMRGRALPPPPKILARMGIREIDVEYEGPLSKSQRSNEVLGIQRLVTYATQLAQIPPPDGVSSVLDNIDGDQAFLYGAEVTGAPSKVIRSKEEVVAIRQARKKQIEAEKVKLDLERMAEGASKAMPAMKAMQEMKEGAPTT